MSLQLMWLLSCYPSLPEGETPFELREAAEYLQSLADNTAPRDGLVSIGSFLGCNDRQLVTS